MTDLSEPIRKLKKVAHQRRAIAALDREHASTAEDPIESREARRSAQENDALAASFEVAVAILEEAQ